VNHPVGTGWQQSPTCRRADRDTIHRPHERQSQRPPSNSVPPLPSAICRPSATRHSVTPACRVAGKGDKQRHRTQGGGRDARCTALLQTMRLWLAFGPFGDDCGGRDARPKPRTKEEHRRSIRVELAFGWVICSHVSLLGRRLWSDDERIESNWIAFPPLPLLLTTAMDERHHHPSIRAL
jgi:hypothetical protein